MPAYSIAQQRLMAQAYALKKGNLDLVDINPKYREEIRDLSKEMSQKQLRDFAATKHKGLPRKKDEAMTTPSNINGIGSVTFPDAPGDISSFANQKIGSGDIPILRKKKHIKLFEEFITDRGRYFDI